MRIAWYDHGYFHQSAAIPDLPRPEEMPFVFSPGLKHSAPNVIGCEMWRIPVFHRLRDDGHEIVMLTKRDIMPSEDLDFDLMRLVDFDPSFEPFVREHDPMLDTEIFFIRHDLGRRYGNEHPDNKTELTGEDSEENRGTWDMFTRWFKDRVFGEPPEVDVAVIAAMRANVATGMEQSYLMGCYLERGTPVIIWDQDRQLSGVLSGFAKMGLEWPHPCATVIAPYDEETKAGRPILLDYPYVDKFEKPFQGIANKSGGVYVGNDYERRYAMERLLLHHTERGIPVTVYGRYQKKGNNTKSIEGLSSDEWKACWPNVNWAGRVEANRVPDLVANGQFTINCVKNDYEKISLLTLRTFDSPLYGTIQVGDKRVSRLASYVPSDFLADSKEESIEIVDRIVNMSDQEYGDVLSLQRDKARTNDMDAFMSRFYEIIGTAIEGGGREE